MLPLLLSFFSIETPSFSNELQTICLLLVLLLLLPRIVELQSGGGAGRGRADVIRRRGAATAAGRSLLYGQVFFYTDIIYTMNTMPYQLDHDGLSIFFGFF